MDYFQGVVNDYLQQFDRATFIKTECLLQLDPGIAPAKGKHWYCDAVAINCREQKVYLCEVTYSTTLYDLAKRLGAWSENWPMLCEALVRDCSVPREWTVQPWVFVPKKLRPALDKRLLSLACTNSSSGTIVMPVPKVTDLEAVTPWEYPSWNASIVQPKCDVTELKNA